MSLFDVSLDKLQLAPLKDGSKGVLQETTEGVQNFKILAIEPSFGDFFDYFFVKQAKWFKVGFGLIIVGFGLYMTLWYSGIIPPAIFTNMIVKQIWYAFPDPQINDNFFL